MNITRSDIRHACYRAKNNQPANMEALTLVEAKLVKGEKWETFAVEWDVLLTASGDIVIIKPEIDYDFVHSTCLEAALYKKKGLEWDFDQRATNVLQIVELNMLDNMKWAEYNKTWGVYIDYELKKIHTKSFRTKQNVVTADMIEASKKSDGAEMVAPGFVPVVDMKMEPFEPSESEKALIRAALGK
jgi:hypothetical protein